MAKKTPAYRRVFGRTAAVELPEHELVQARGQKKPEIEEAKTCDGELTITPRGKDCEGGAGWDDWAN